MTEPSRPWLSVVIPAYNEAGRLPAGLAQVRHYAEGTGRPIEVIVADDGSTDGTAAAAGQFDAGPLAVRVLREGRRRGKGHAVRRGALAATGELVLVSDADWSTPIGQIEKLACYIERGDDIVIGSRDMADSVLSPPQGRFRRAAGRGFRGLRRLMLLRDLRDTQCGFKLFRAEVVGPIFSRCVVDNFACDIEVLAIARKLGYRIREVGVVWCNDPVSKVRPLVDPLRALLSLFGIKWRLRRLRPPAE